MSAVRFVWRPGDIKVVPRPRLFTNVLRYDEHKAPNPYWGTCTLAICKPAIRRAAGVGDWVVGVGAEEFGLSGRVVYAMRVTGKMTMREYDAFTKASLRGKIPSFRAKDRRRRFGDSIYDFSQDPPRQRPGVHERTETERDLGGGYVLLSTDFVYFGSEGAPELDADLLPIAAVGRGHRANLNDPYVGRFAEWLGGIREGCCNTVTSENFPEETE
jgi:hypothetical protein